MADKTTKYVSGEEYEAIRSSRTSGKKQLTLPLPLLLSVVAVVIIGVVSFAAGISYQKHHATSPASVATLAARTGGFGGFGGRRGGGEIGQVTAVTSNSITVSNPRTNIAKTYAITSATAITDNGQPVAATDITTSDTVLITTSTTDTATATSILVNPSFGGASPDNSPSGTSQTN